MADRYKLPSLENLHRKILLDSLQTFKSMDSFTDVTIKVEGKTFRAHKVILASCSWYFKSMFTNGMVEHENNEANIAGISATGFEAILDYIYSSTLKITLRNVQDILATAIYTQINPVIEECVDFLIRNIDGENCTDIATIADNYALDDLKIRVFNFVTANFFSVANTDDFYKLSPEQIEYVVTQDMPIDVTELKFLEYILIWLFEDNRQKTDKKLKHIDTILKNIRFYEIAPSQLETMLDNVFSTRNIDKTNNVIYEKIMKISHQPENLLRTQQLSSNNTFNTRGMHLAIVKVGGFGINGITNDLTFSLINEKHWKYLTSIPHVEQCNYGTAVLKNELYLVGGCFNQVLQEVIHPFGFKYNPRTNTWQKIRSMLVERCRFTLNVLEDKLYAVAGAIETNGFELEATKTAEVYNPITGAWTAIESLPESRQQHAAVAFPLMSETENLLFVSGGIHKDRVIASMFVYNTLKNTWSSCAPLLTPRADHFMVTYKSKVYVCGGWREDPAVSHLRIQVGTIDSYDITNNTWSFVTTVPTPRFHTGVVALDSKIYFIGGFHNDAMFHKDTSAIECYDIVTDTWTQGEKNSQDFWEHTCVTLYVPKHCAK